MNSQYMCVPVPQGVRVTDRADLSVCSTAFQNLLNHYAGQGWKFENVTQFAIAVRPGCLGVLLGAKSSSVAHYVVTFSKAF